MIIDWWKEKSKITESKITEWWHSHHRATKLSINSIRGARRHMEIHQMPTYTLNAGATQVTGNVQPDSGGGSYAPVTSLSGSITTNGTGTISVASSPDANGNYAFTYTSPGAGSEDVTFSAVPGPNVAPITLKLTFITPTPTVLATQLVVNGIVGATLTSP